ncbi:MAG: hypothetical protein NTZ21_01085 [Actinobacteria bacterium]|nr:hypothetical protein [Actinomycetota bacterium]
MLQLRDRRVIALVGVMAASLFVFVAMVSFGVNTSCTNAWSCTSNSCSPCRIVGAATVGGLAIGALLSVGVLLSPWPRRGRVPIYTVAMIVLAVLVLVVAQTWDAPTN